MMKKVDIKLAVKYIGDNEKGEVSILINDIGDAFFDMLKGANFINIRGDHWDITNLGKEFYNTHSKKISLFDKIRFKINEFISKI